MEDSPSKVTSGRSIRHKKPTTRSPAVKPGRETSPNLETRHHLQRRFHGNKCTPNTARWVAQQIAEVDTPRAIGILSAWTHPTRYVEASEATLVELNSLSDEEAIEALSELKTSRRYIQGTGGNKLTMRIILSTLDNSKSLDTSALLDCGCTGSTIHTHFVKQHNLPTRKLPRPIPVYNADGTLNRNGVIKETTTLQMIIQDHVEEITFAISDLGNTDI